MSRAADAKPWVASPLPENHAERPASLIRARRVAELLLLWGMAFVLLVARLSDAVEKTRGIRAS